MSVVFSDGFVSILKWGLPLDPNKVFSIFFNVPSFDRLSFFVFRPFFAPGQMYRSNLINSVLSLKWD